MSLKRVLLFSLCILVLSGLVGCRETEITVKSEFIKEDMDETVFMFALFKCRKFDKRRN